MKRSQIVFFMTPILAIILCLESVAEEKPWFDLENCAFCKNLSAEPGLVEHMCTEYHDLSNGVIAMTVIDEEYREAYQRAQKNMQKVAEEWNKTGQTPYTCGFCSAYGEFMMAGVKFEPVHGEEAEVLLMTSDDPVMVEKLHAFGKRSTEEMAKARGARKVKKGKSDE